MVRRRRALPRPGATLHRARPLRSPHALQPGRAARGGRRAADRRRPGRDRPAQNLAALRRQLPPLPRHAVVAVAQPRLHRGVRLHRAPVGRQRRSRSTTTSPHAWRGREFRPRALFERFNIEALATTESPLDDLEASPQDQGERLARARAHRLPSRSGRRSRLSRLPRQSRRARPQSPGDDVSTFAGLPRRARRAARLFQVGRLHLDRPRPPDRAHRRPRAERSGRALRPRAQGRRVGRRTPRPSAPRC